MKNRMPKIMGILVTLALLVSLFAFAVPVSAANLAWTAVGIPGAVGNRLVGANIDIAAVAISPNFATDQTMFAAVTDPTNAVNSQVYRSTNGGYSWVPNSGTLGTGAFEDIVDIVVSPNYATDRTVVVAVQLPAGGAGTGIVYRSTDGGSTFSQLGVVTLGAAEIITSLDISPNYDGVGVLAIGIADIATAVVPATAATSVQVWGLAGTLTWTNYGPAAAVDVSAIKFSPSYPVDATILAVTSLAGAQPVLMGNVGGIWTPGVLANTNVGATAVTDLDRLGAGVATDLIRASLVLPSDYNASVSTTRRAYVAIVDEAGVIALGTGGPAVFNSNVYRITGAGAAATGVPITAAANGLIGDLAFSGTYGAGTLIGGRYGHLAAIAATVYRTTNPTDAATSVLWNGATNAPTGATTAGTLALFMTVSVALASDFATSTLMIAGTQGDDSAFARSLGGANWNESGLIDNAGAALAVVGDVALSPKFATDTTMFMLTNNAGGGATTNDTSFWRSVDGGTKWLRLFSANFAGAGGGGKIALSPTFDTDQALYVADVGALAIQYSTNKGDSQSARAIPAGLGIAGIADIAITDANTIYAADNASGNVAKSINAGWVWAAGNVKASGSAGALISIVAKGSTVVVGDNASTAFKSTDASVTWARVGPGAMAAAGNTYVDFDGDYTYATVAAIGGVYRYKTGDAGWYTASTPAATRVATGRGVRIAADGTEYVLDAAVTANQVVYRTLTPNSGPTPAAPTFEWITGLTAVAAGDFEVVPGASNIILTVQGVLINIFTDTLSKASAGPKLLGPANGATLGSTNAVVFSVDNTSNPEVTSWDIQYSSDSTFTNGVTTVNQVIPATQAAAVVIVSNSKQYFRARATLGFPLRGPYSEVRSFSPQLTTPPNFPAPAYPAGIAVVNVPINPMFNWAALTFATGYELQIAKSSDFAAANMVSDLTGAKALGNTTSYSPTAALDFDTPYYWRVRAINATGGTTDWSPVIGFRTLAKPAPVTTAPPPVTIPPATTITITQPPATTITINPPAPAPIVQSNPVWIYAIIVVGAVLIIAVIVLIVRTRRVV